MGALYLCLALAGIAIALYYPPVFVVILIICIPKIGIIPLILYLFFISFIYKMKRSVK